MVVVLEGQGAVDMHDLVVPGRHMAVMVRLGRVEAGRDIGIVGAEDGKHLLFRADQAVHVVGERDMTDERAVGGGENGDVVGHKPRGRLRDDAGERCRGNRRGDGLGAGLGEMRGQVHGARAPSSVLWSVAVLTVAAAGAGRRSLGRG